MRRIITLVVCVVLTIPFVGCASNTSEEQMGKDPPVKSNTILREGLSIPSVDEQAAFNLGEDIYYPGGYDRVLAKEKLLAEGEVVPAKHEILATHPDGSVTLHDTSATMPDFNEKFFYIQALYRKAFEEYLSKKIDLSKMDNAIAKDPIGYIPYVKKPEDQKYIPIWQTGKYQNFYQEHSTLGLSYIYLRNNIYIEQLSSNDLKVFEEYYKNNDTEITNELLEIVGRTYPDVLSGGMGKDSKIQYQNFPGKEAPSNAVVFEIAFQDNDEFWAKYAGKMSVDDAKKLVDTWNNKFGFENECKGVLGDTPIVFFINGINLPINTEEMG